MGAKVASEPKLGMSQAMGGRREEIFRVESQLTKFSHLLLALIAQLPRGDSAAQAECDGQGDSRMAIGIVGLALYWGLSFKRRLGRTTGG